MTADSSRSRDLPLIRWGEELRGRKAQRRKFHIRMISVGAFVALVVTNAVVRPAPRLVWNASASAPIGLYIVHVPASLRHGDLVVAKLAPLPASLAATRGYLPRGVPLVKRVVGLPGNRICADHAIVSVNGAPLATQLSSDAMGRPLPVWHGCRTLGATQYLLLNNAAARSFDGRYFGPSNRSDILGKATPLWLR